MTVRVAAVQPPLDIDHTDVHGTTTLRGLELLGDAVEGGAQIVCLPEYFAAIGLDALDPAEQSRRAQAVIDACCDVATRHEVTVLCPTVEHDGWRAYNTTWLMRGGATERYRKTHLTLSERTRRGLSPGDDLPVFEAEGIPLAVAACYDMYFPETARVLALRGARVVFFPAFQRAESLDTIQLQVRSRAFDNCVYVVRVAFGHPQGVAPRPGITLGGTCVADWEGRLIADLGIREGVLYADIPDAPPPVRLRSYEGAPDNPAEYLFSDRRPELYGAIVAGLPGPRE